MGSYIKNLSDAVWRYSNINHEHGCEINTCIDIKDEVNSIESVVEWPFKGYGKIYKCYLEAIVGPDE